MNGWSEARGGEGERNFAVLWIFISFSRNIKKAGFTGFGNAGEHFQGLRNRRKNNELRPRKPVKINSSRELERKLSNPNRLGVLTNVHNLSPLE